MSHDLALYIELNDVIALAVSPWVELPREIAMVCLSLHNSESRLFEVQIKIFVVRWQLLTSNSNCINLVSLAFSFN